MGTDRVSGAGRQRSLQLFGDHENRILSTNRRCLISTHIDVCTADTPHVS